MLKSNSHKRHLPQVEKGDTCLNCESKLDLEANFCPNCGQLNNNKRISFTDMLLETLGDFFAYDSRFFNSLRPLLLKPAKASIEYINGIRTFHIHPIRLYFIVSFVFFLFSSIEVKDKIMEQDENINKELSKKDYIAFNSNGELVGTDRNLIYQLWGINDSTAVESKLISNSKESFLSRFRLFMISAKNGVKNLKEISSEYGIVESSFNNYLFKKAIELKEFNVTEFSQKYKEKLPLFAFFFLPIFGAFLNLLHARKDILYYEHLIFAFHIQSLLFIVLTLNAIIDLTQINVLGMLKFAAYIYFAIYLYQALKKFYLYRTWYGAISMYVVINLSFLILAIMFTAISFFIYLLLYSLF